MDREHILIVEDDEDIQQLVSYNLVKEGFGVSCAISGTEALDKINSSELPDLVLLDLMLPGPGGLEICRALRQNPLTAKLPIIMLTAKGEEEDIVKGLEAGADDYITKPFSPKVLLARLRAVLRRRQETPAENSPATSQPLSIHGLTIDPIRHEVRYQEQPIPLTPSEFAILTFLAGRPGWVFTRQQIIDNIRGYDFTVTPRAIDVQVFGLRKKMNEAGSLIETVRGIGYRFRE